MTAKKLLTSILVVFLNLAFITGSIFGWETGDDEIEREVEVLIRSYERPVLVEISNKLIRIAADEDEDGDYFNSVKHFREAIVLRNKLGLPKNDLSYANLLYLTSISEMHLEAYCDAKEHAEEAYKIYMQKNNEQYSSFLGKELKTMTSSCMIAVSEELSMSK